MAFTIGNGIKTCVTASAMNALTGPTGCHSVLIKAASGNTGDVYVGNSDATVANGYYIGPGKELPIDGDPMAAGRTTFDLTAVYVGADNANDVVRYVYQYMA